MRPHRKQPYNEPQPEVHIGWADIYLDLILVGVAFNGGLLLKHAFYLCHPEHDAHGELQPVDNDTGHGLMRHRLLSGGGDEAHPPCVGLGLGMVHAMAFAAPILGAWSKETIFDAQFDSQCLLDRGLECLGYLLVPPGWCSNP